MTEEKDFESIEKKKEKDSYRRLLAALNTAIKNAALYAENHPTIEMTCTNVKGVLDEMFHSKLEISIKHMDAIFVIEDQLFIEESIMMFDLLHLLEESKVTGVTFLPDIPTDEIKKFILGMNRLSKNPETVADSKALSSDHLRVMGQVDEEQNLDLKASRKGRFDQVMSHIEQWNKLSEGIFERLLSEQTFLMSEVATPLDNIIDIIDIDPGSVGTALTLPPQNLHTEHAVRTMILSIYIGRRMGLDIPSLKSLAIASLLHDAGRFLLPSEFASGQTLNPGDESYIQLHTRDGAAFLAGVKGLPATTVRVALEHHIGFDGGGYPKLPDVHRPHYFSYIVGLADFVSWQTVSERFYHKPIPHHRLMRSVIKRSGSQFHPVFVKLLLPLFGLYPHGTAVRLDSGLSGISMQATDSNIRRPEIVVAKTKNEWDYLNLVGLKNLQFSADIANAIRFQPNSQSLLPLLPPSPKS